MEHMKWLDHHLSVARTWCVYITACVCVCVGEFKCDTHAELQHWPFKGQSNNRYVDMHKKSVVTIFLYYVFIQLARWECSSRVCECALSKVAHSRVLTYVVRLLWTNKSESICDLIATQLQKCLQIWSVLHMLPISLIVITNTQHTSIYVNIVATLCKSICYKHSHTHTHHYNSEKRDLKYTIYAAVSAR